MPQFEIQYCNGGGNDGPFKSETEAIHHASRRVSEQYPRIDVYENTKEDRRYCGTVKIETETIRSIVIRDSMGAELFRIAR